jgi:rhodanese-related sulfurtransferase
MMTQVDRNEVKRLISRGAQLVEVLPKAEYEEEHLPGAINVFLKRLLGSGGFRFLLDVRALG